MPEEIGVRQHRTCLILYYPYFLGTERAYNAALSGEQRRPPYLNHCAVNTKAESNRKCRALGIRLKRFVMFIAQVVEQTRHNH
ncbi:hypothetical protein F1K70_24500 [Vibrio parahaemolyticus]|nr:hypothetical protein [Vibrio parahaemolyticus]EGQ9423433.1 hypothetical protein [Vibrio parahaemolyticus]EGQ9428290.1 hypothetical protein [Vibrio parahaemolyticus]EGQ9687779.1 hypothetical protein [Vibrio parahaemolyticus]EGQ9931427.1 hypothetical protein [Vibrio parahaemolyticus]